MSCQRNVFAQLAQEITLAATEAARFATGRDEHTEYPAFHEERRGDQRPQSTSRQPLRERKARRADIRFVHELPAYAVRQPVLIDVDPRLLGERQVHRKFLATHAHASYDELVVRRFVQAHATE